MADLDLDFGEINLDDLRAAAQVIEAQIRKCRNYRKVTNYAQSIEKAFALEDENPREVDDLALLLANSTIATTTPKTTNAQTATTTTTTTTTTTAATEAVRPPAPPIVRAGRAKTSKMINMIGGYVSIRLLYSIEALLCEFVRTLMLIELDKHTTASRRSNRKGSVWRSIQGTRCLNWKVHRHQTNSKEGFLSIVQSANNTPQYQAKPTTLTNSIIQTTEDQKLGAGDRRSRVLKVISSSKYCTVYRRCRGLSQTKQRFVASQCFQCLCHIG